MISKKSKRFIMGSVVFLIVLLLLPVIVVNVTPSLTALYVRHLFKEPIATTPPGYDQYSSKVAVHKDLTYPSQYKNNTFNIYMPKAAESKPKPLPTIIWVHGGAFVGGDKDQIDIYSTVLASQGYIVLNMNYELAPEATYPAPVVQLDEFYRHIEAIHTKYPIDVHQLFFAGDSAGAQIVSSYVTIQTNSELANKMGLEQVVPKNSLKGVLLYCGPYNIEKFNKPNQSAVIRFALNQIAWSYLGTKNWQETEEANLVSVVHHVNEQFPPAFITDGNKGSFEDQGKELAAKLVAQQVEVDTLFFAKDVYETGHEFQFKLDTPPGQQALQATLAFLQKHVAQAK
ncbi:alpha/beta hydrolase [Paenibacillus sp. ACRRX]|uniref:alpha/beta hydrolase n=1 Tax=Paenibacillus sp. ACRRX TaxID=2918206 RepID=UPI001EF6FD84|nr:alpha/beta hydrolase [Paenibacillus sp. ACRRX]MCG7408936.1 alpha/beta hydrolase [Paenibacillus sp. ACRRX]